MRSPIAKLLLVPVLLVCWTAGCAPEPIEGPEKMEGPEKLVIGHPACMSGKYAKAGEQALGGIQACVAWVNDVHGGVSIGDRKVPLEYKYYDSESKKEGVTSLIERLITVDKVNVVFSSYSSGLTLAGAPVAERYGMVFMDHGGASDRIFQSGSELRHFLRTADQRRGLRAQQVQFADVDGCRIFVAQLARRHLMQCVGLLQTLRRQVKHPREYQCHRQAQRQRHNQYFAGPARQLQQAD